MVEKKELVTVNVFEDDEPYEDFLHQKGNKGNIERKARKFVSDKKSREKGNGNR